MATTAVSTSIDWRRLAEPQPDQYDTDVVFELAATTTSPARPSFYRRTPVGDSASCFDGQVAVRNVYRPLPEFAAHLAKFPDAPPDHPNIAQAAEYVRRWPIAFAQCQRLLESIHPALHPDFPTESTDVYRGSLCHSFESHFGTMWATIFCPPALAEAIVHEMAHQKLRVLGVSFESAYTIVGNDPAQLYVSPIIKERLRPMTAVLHAEYSYVHVTELDLHLVQAEKDPRKRGVFRHILMKNADRIEEGYQTLRSQFQPGPHGREFIDNFFAWIERLLASARSVPA